MVWVQYVSLVLEILTGRRCKTLRPTQPRVRTATHFRRKRLGDITASQYNFGVSLPYWGGNVILASEIRGVALGWCARRPLAWAQVTDLRSVSLLPFGEQRHTRRIIGRQ